MNDDDEVDALFESHIATLPETERPENRPQERRMFVDWEDRLKSELNCWKDELKRNWRIGLSTSSRYSTVQKIR